MKGWGLHLPSEGTPYVTHAFYGAQGKRKREDETSESLVNQMSELAMVGRERACLDVETFLARNVVEGQHKPIVVVLWGQGPPQSQSVVP